MLDYKKEYERWAKADMPDFDLTRELQLMAGKEEEIKEHFANGSLYSGGRSGEESGNQLRLSIKRLDLCEGGCKGSGGKRDFRSTL